MADIHTSHIDYGALPRAVRKFPPGVPGVLACRWRVGRSWVVTR